MNIAVCDDNMTSAQMVSDIIKRIEPDNEVYIFTKGEELLNSETEWDIAFLDIEMEEMNGFQIATVLRKKHKKCIFSFITTHGELAVDGYDYQPFRYILKSAPETVIERKIRDTLVEYQFHNKKLQISYKGQHRQIRVDKISHIEIMGHCLKIRYGDELILWNKSLKELEKELEKYGFIRCHRSFLISLDHIKMFGTKIIEMDNGEKISVGRLYQKQTEAGYAKFLVNSR